MFVSFGSRPQTFIGHREPVQSDIQKDACEKIKFSSTIQIVADMHVMSGYVGDDGPKSIYCKHQNFYFFLSVVLNIA